MLRKFEVVNCGILKVGRREVGGCLLGAYTLKRDAQFSPKTNAAPIFPLYPSIVKSKRPLSAQK